MKRIARNQPAIPGFKISRLKYLVHLIMFHKQDDHKGAYSVLKMEYLRNIVPSAHLYMYYLRDLRIIEWLNHSQGRNSRLYRLIDEGRTVERPILDIELVNRIEENYKKTRRHNSKKYPLQNNTIRLVKINVKAARKDVESEYKILGNDSRRNYFLSQIQEIHLGHFTISVNDTNNRLNSNFTRLPSYLMKHLTLDGQPLFELDLKNSQPFIAACLFNPRPEVEEIMAKFMGKYLTKYMISLHLHLREDVKLYTSLVCSGKFYDYMEVKFREKGLRFRDRDHLKERIFRILYSSNKQCKRQSAAKLFRELFPNVYGLFYSIKLHNHSNLANMLTTIESHLVLDNVVPAIHVRFPDLHIITKHDAILPFESKLYMNSGSFTDSVRDIFLDTIETCTGLRPKVKITAGASTTFGSEKTPTQKPKIQ